MKIKNGGKTDSLSRKKYVEELRAYFNGDSVGSSRSISLMVNGDSLSYLSLEEALQLRDELNEAVKKATGLA